MIAQKRPRLLLGLLIIIVSFLMVNSPRVYAIIENGGWVPPNLRIPPPPGGDCTPKAHAQSNWISPRNQSSLNSASVPYGTSTLALQWQYDSAICNNGLDAAGNALANIQNLQATFVENTGVSVNSATSAAIPGISVSVGTPRNIAFGYDYTRRYQPTTQAPVPIDVTLPTNLAPGTYAVTLNISSRSGHSYSTNPPGKLECVQPAGASKLVVSKLSECPEGTRSKTITLTVEQPTNVIGNFERADCSLIQGWAYDDDAGTSPIEVHLYIDGVGWNTGPTNVDRPDLPGNTTGRVKGIKHGFSVPATGSPVNLFDGATHVVNAFGINVGPGVNKQLSNNWPIDSDYGRTIQCVQTSGTFKITPHPQKPTLKPNTESPTSADFSATFTSDVARVKNVTTTCRYYALKSDGTLLGELGSSTPQTQEIDSSGTAHCGDDGISLSSVTLTAGDKVCIDAKASPGGGSVDGSGTVTNINPTEASVVVPECERVANKPYVSFYGSDVQAGGDIAGADHCSDKAATIDTYTGSNGGASVQFAAFALGSISGFSTASLRSAAPTPPNGLRAANFGNYSAACTHDYYNDVGGGTYTDTFVEGKQTFASDVTLVSPTIGRGEHVYLYVNGNVTIKGQVTMDPGPWTNRKDIPSFYVISTKNIYIDKDTEHLAGVFVAQQGGIYTCTNGSTPYDVSEIYDNCGKQLVIDGAFITRKTVLHRTFGSLRNAGSDNAYAATSAKACATKEPTQPATNSCAGEVFRFSPAIYLAETPASNGGSNTIDTSYQYIANLPPIL